MVTLRTLVAALAVAIAPSPTYGKAVFAHYMIGGIDGSTNHAQTDIDQAIAVGFDAFALNAGAPDASWAIDAVTQLFDHAKGKNFGLFFSFDFYANGDMGKFQALYDKFKDHDAYYRYGPDNQNVVSSFSGGSIGPDAWKSFKDKNNVFLLPNLDQEANYYDNPEAFFDKWGGVVDGVFSWESAWPGTSDTPSNATDTRDIKVKEVADSKFKGYVMGLSPLQYKRCCGVSWYRRGESTLGQRMEQILSVQPEFAEVITWNDAGESHYIGSTWHEALIDEILKYGDSEKFPHDGWQQIIGPFVDAFKSGHSAAEMVPRNDKPAGSMWYRGILTSCNGEKPPGAGAAADAINYALVLPAGSDGYKIRVSSNNKEIGNFDAVSGLNYNSVEGMTAGPQKVEIVNSDGTVLATAASDVDVQQGPVGDFCNFNYYVAGFD